MNNIQKQLNDIENELQDGLDQIERKTFSSVEMFKEKIKNEKIKNISNDINNLIGR